MPAVEEHDVKRLLDLAAPVVSAVFAKLAGTLATNERYSCRDPVLVDIDASRESAAGTVADACRFRIGNALLAKPASGQATP